VVADHGEWPIERISIGGGHGQLSIDTEDPCSTKIGDGSTDGDQNQTRVFGENYTQRRWWVGSVGHEEILRLTDLEGFFRDNEHNQDSKGTLGVDTTGSSEDSDIEECEENEEQGDDSAEMMATVSEDDNEASEQESNVAPPKKRKRQFEEPIVATKKKKEKNAVVVERSFFDEL